MQNQIPKGWRKVKLGEVVDINSQQIDRNYSYEKIEYVDISAVGIGTLELSTDYLLSNAPGRAKRIVKDGDTILSTVRPNRRSFYYFKEPKDNLIVSTGFAVLSSKPNITNNRFIYYLVTQKAFTHYLTSNVKGSAYPAVSTDVIENANVLLPSYKDQKQIALILSAFDDKIEINNKIAKNLEETAQAIFKEWFVKFKFPGNEKVKFVDSELGKIPEDWDVKKLSDVAKINKGLSYSSKNINYEHKGLPLINLANFQRGGGFNPEGIKYYTGKYIPNNEVKPGDIIVALTDLTSNREIIGHPARVPIYDQWNKILISLDVCSVNTDESNTEFLYYLLLRKEFSYLMASSAGGTNVAHLSPKFIESYEFVMPDKITIEKFKKIILPIFIKNNILEEENQKLAEMRDLLLPKLMKGEIKV